MQTQLVPASVLARLDREFDDLVRRAWSTPGRTTPNAFMPAVELVREDRDLVLVVEVPGLDPDAITVELERGKLAIAGERRAPESAGQVLVRELRYGAFRREFQLPSHLTAEQLSASYDAGMLTVRITDAIAPEPVPTRIQVGVGAARPTHAQGTIEQGEQPSVEGQAAAKGDEAA